MFNLWLHSEEMVCVCVYTLKYISASCSMSSSSFSGSNRHNILMWSGQREVTIPAHALILKHYRKTVKLC